MLAPIIFIIWEDKLHRISNLQSVLVLDICLVLQATQTALEQHAHTLGLLLGTEATMMIP